MTVNGEEFSRRLEGYSDDTMRLISSFDQISKELALKALDIVATTATEEEVVAKLLQLKKKSFSTKSTQESETVIYYQMDAESGRTVRVSEEDLPKWMEGQVAIEKGEAPHLSEESYAKLSKLMGMSNEE